MKPMPVLLAASLVAAGLSIPSAVPIATAAPADAIGTLALGHFICELPGTALGPTGLRRPDADFDILNASAYRSAAGGGSYLLVGDVVTFTSGPRRGEKYHRISANFLRRLNPDGSDAPLRCVRRNRNNR